MVSIVNELAVKELVQRYRHVRDCVVVNCQGIKALESNQLRKELGARNINVEVVRNTLVSMAFKEVGLDSAGKLFEGPSALVSGSTDSVVLAKAVVEWTKKIPSIKIKGGIIEGKVVSIPEVEALSLLPAKTVLHTQLATLVQSPLSRLAAVLSAPLRNLGACIEALKSKKEKEGNSVTGG